MVVIFKIKINKQNDFVQKHYIIYSEETHIYAISVLKPSIYFVMIPEIRKTVNQI